MPLADGRRNAISWATDAPGGFSLGERNELRNLAGPLGLVLDLLEWRRTARTLLDTYLGRGPGHEVLNGAIRRGDRRELEAVILFADLRDFTAKAASWSVEQLLAALDAYYQALVDAITVAGGEVLKFMGDGLLGGLSDRPARAVWPRPASARWRPPWRRATRSPQPTRRGARPVTRRSSSASPSTSVAWSTATSAGRAGSTSR